MNDSDENDDLELNIDRYKEPLDENEMDISQEDTETAAGVNDTKRKRYASEPDLTRMKEKADPNINEKLKKFLEKRGRGKSVDLPNLVSGEEKDKKTGSLIRNDKRKRKDKKKARKKRKQDTQPDDDEPEYYYLRIQKRHKVDGKNFPVCIKEYNKTRRRWDTKWFDCEVDAMSKLLQRRKAKHKEMEKLRKKAKARAR